MLWLSVESWELLSSSPQPMQYDGTRAEIRFMDELIYWRFINIVVWGRKPSKQNEASERAQKCWLAWHTAWKHAFIMPQSSASALSGCAYEG